MTDTNITLRLTTAEIHDRLTSWAGDARKNSGHEEQFYVDLGIKTVRIISYSPALKPLLRKELTWSLRENAESYDATIIAWFNPATIHREHTWMFDENENLAVLYGGFGGEMQGYDAIDDLYYYTFPSTSVEDFLKQGHALCRLFYLILKTPDSNFVHGACVGIDGKGALICARGSRGKSTLTVHALLNGFEYVSDDYLLISQEGAGLYAYPIYSIITLSPRMYNEMFDQLEGSRFISNNLRNEKYVLNIANCHDRFRSRYPIRICLFPEIVDDPQPSIERCSPAEKGQAITHMAHSTMSQVNDVCDNKTVLKIIRMLNSRDFYKIRLCRDIRRNTELLREFLKNID